MKHIEMKPNENEVRIRNIRDELESLMVNLVWSTEKVFDTPDEEMDAKLKQTTQLGVHVLP